MLGQGLLLPLFRGYPIVTREADPSVLGPVAQVWPEERAAMLRAVEKRRYEYFACRHLARQAFSELGLAPRALLNHDDRSPSWPPEVIGSLSHTAGWCGVAVALRETSVRSLGIDGERIVPMSDGVLERVLTSAERDAPCGPSESRCAVLRFSAKEAVYKALYPLLRRFIGFHEVEVWPDFSCQTFSVKPISAQLVRELEATPALRGSFGWDDEMCVTAVVVSA